MADQQHTEERGYSPLHLSGTDERARWLSVREHVEFCVAAPDDSMAPAIRLGARLTFDSRLTPRDGDFALFVDADGRAFVREYRPKSNGGFRAVPCNRRFRTSTFHARRDALVVLGVLTGHSVGRAGTR